MHYEAIFKGSLNKSFFNFNKCHSGKFVFRSSQLIPHISLLQTMSKWQQRL